MTHERTAHSTARRDPVVSVVDNVHGLESLRADWEDLFAEANSASIFLTWQWVCTWAEQFIGTGRRLFVLTVTDGSRLIGLAPFYVSAAGPLQPRAIGFLGFPETGSDYLDILARRGHEKVVAHTLMDALFGALRSHWDILSLDEVPSDSPILAHMLSSLRAAGKQYTIEEASYCPRVSLPDTFDAYFATLSAHRRKQLRRETRILLSLPDVSHRIVGAKDDFGVWLPAFFGLYAERWGSSTGELFEFVKSYLRKTNHEHTAELSLITVGERVVAGLLHLIDRRSMRMYLMAVNREFRRDISIGNVLCGLNIERAANRGFKVYDFLKGDEPYKALWMNDGKRAVRVSVHNRTFASITAYVAKSAKGFGKILVR